MSIENITLFSELHAEPSWLQDLRKKAFNKIDQLELPAIERVKFHRWNLGDGTITESEASANVPDFTALDSNLKLVQVGTQTVFEQVPQALADQGVLFTDFHTALEEIPQVVKDYFMSSVKYDDDKLQHTTRLILIVGLCYMFQITSKFQNPSKVFSTRIATVMYLLISTF